HILTGTVVAADTGKPVPFARLTAFQSWDPARHGMMGVDGKADAEGRFRLNPYPANSYDVTAFGPTGTPYLAKKLTVEWPAAAKEHEIKLQLKRGVLIRGRVIDEKSGTPLAGAKVTYDSGQDSPSDSDDTVFGWQSSMTADENGNFALAAPHG